MQRLPEDNYTNAGVNMLRDKLNEVIDLLNGLRLATQKPEECLHPGDRVYKFGRVVRCKDCGKTWKP